MTAAFRRAARAAAGPLMGGTVLLLADALGGVVKVPGDVVTYMALTGLVPRVRGSCPCCGWPGGCVRTVWRRLVVCWPGSWSCLRGWCRLSRSLRPV